MAGGIYHEHRQIGGKDMTDMWAYTPEKCDGDYCPGDCDYCYKVELNDTPDGEYNEDGAVG